MSLPSFVPQTTVAALGRGAAGDVVVWAQEHLLSAGQKVTVDGGFGAQTQTAVQRFQAAKGLAVTGIVDARTWAALLAYQPAAITWVLHKNTLTATVTRDGRAVLQVPASASLPERRDELAGTSGSGRP